MFGSTRKTMEEILKGVKQVNQDLTGIILEGRHTREDVNSLLMRVRKLELITEAGDYEYVTKLEKKKEDWKK